MTEMLQWINAGAIGIIGILLAVIAYFFKRALDEITSRLDKLDEKQTLGREELLKEYVTKEHCDKSEQSRKETWVEINAIRERIAKMGG